MTANVEKILTDVENLSASEKKQLINALLGKYFLPKSEEEDENEDIATTSETEQ